ncbi:FKBP-type peptidyl-prolyl cis-trans isomerase [Chloropicon primus]|nr:FKBP-type peptidyl-prolyl cis-trans isomerase [Chloropicon primus]
MAAKSWRVGNGRAREVESERCVGVKVQRGRELRAARPGSEARADWKGKTGLLLLDGTWSSCDRRAALLLGLLTTSGVGLLGGKGPAFAEDQMGGGVASLQPEAASSASPPPPPQVTVEEIVDVQPDSGADKTEEDSTILLASSEEGSLDDKDLKALQLNRQILERNRAPKGFPEFVRRGYDMIVFADGYTQLENGLIYKEFESGDPEGRKGKDGDEVTFHYTGYNEEGGFIDSSYKQKRPAQIRLGIGGMIPGFELAVKDMVPGSRRRVIIPPALGPPVGPATFFSAKQYEVFDIQLLGIKSCTRRGFGIVSTVKCE